MSGTGRGIPDDAATPRGVPPDTHLAPDTGVDAESPFLGRDREIGELLRGLADASAGRRRIFLVVGEPGIGKTRLTTEFARLAEAQGAETVWGRAWEGGGAPPYWPWVQAMRETLRRRPLEGETLAGQGPLAQLLPELGGDAEPAAASVGAEEARFRLFESVARFFEAAARERPLVLVLDDLHAADHASVLLLRFLARTLGDARLVVCATYRDVEARRRAAVAEDLAEIGREAVTLAPRALSVSDVARLASATAGVPAGDRLAADLHRTTEGNPLFVWEMLRLLVSEQGGDLGEGLPETLTRIPEGIRQTIIRRAESVPPATRELLATAAVLGRDFDATTLAEVAARDLADTVEELGEAVAAGLLTPGTASVTLFSFSHGLVRETLYTGIPPHRRIGLHRRAAEALEARYAGGLEPHLAEVAHHFTEAAALGVADRALEYNVRAAERAASLFSYEEAGARYAAALRVTGFLPDGAGGEARRWELLVALGDMQWRAGMGPEAKATFLEAAGLARAMGDPAKLGRAAIGFGADAITTGVVDGQLVALLQESLDALGEEDSALRANLMARLAQELSYSDEEQRRKELSERAVEMARRIGDPQVLVFALEALGVAEGGPKNLAVREEIGDEILKLTGSRTAPRELALHGHMWRIGALLERGEIQRAELDLRAYEELAAELRQPGHVWFSAVVRTALELFAGRLASAERRSHDARELGAGRDEEAEQFHIVQRLSAARLRGRVDDQLAHDVERLAVRYPAVPAFRAALACVHLDAGRTSSAAAEVEQLAGKGFADLHENFAWLAAMAFLSEATGRLGAADRAEELFALLSRYPDRNVVFDWSVACFGSVRRYLGLLAATLDRGDDAVRHLEAAVEANRRMGARPYVALAQLDLARVLSERDEEAAVEVARTALDTCRELGMDGHADRAFALLDELGASPDVERVGATEKPLIRGRYEPLEVVGRGGQDSMIRALDHQHERPVAIKTRATETGARRRELLAEARLLLGLRPHPNLPLVREDFFDARSYHLVMDWIEGTDLARLLEQRGDPGLPLPLVIEYLEQAAEAIDHLHAHDPPIVHRDVKPANMVLTGDGRIVLVDLGIAAPLAEGERPSGTPGYQAPEAARGAAVPASDVYGLAATAVALLTGRPPELGGTRIEGLPPAVAGTIERALRRGLSTDPARRPGSGRELVERLRAAQHPALPVGTVTFLAVDLAGTDTWDRQASLAARASARFRDLLEDVVGARGAVTASRGDREAALVAFERAADAISAAVELRRRVHAASWPGGVQLGTRIGVETGDATVDEGIYRGEPVRRSVALRDLAGHGGVLLGRTAADLAGDALPDGVAARPIGDLPLPGLGRTGEVVQLVDAALGDAGAPT